MACKFIRMSEEEYLSCRLDSQINWYYEKSSWNQGWFKKLRILEILAASSIPFVTGYITDQAPYMKLVVGGLGVLIAAISGVVALFKFQEHWLQYRTTAESLKHQKYRYLTNTAPYDIDASFNLLVETVEGLVSKENSKWATNIKDKAKEKGAK